VPAPPPDPLGLEETEPHAATVAARTTAMRDRARHGEMGISSISADSAPAGERISGLYTREKGNAIASSLARFAADGVPLLRFLRT
jgi:hypothetical protein